MFYARECADGFENNPQLTVDSGCINTDMMQKVCTHIRWKCKI